MLCCSINKERIAVVDDAEDNDKDDNDEDDDEYNEDELKHMQEGL